MTIWGQIFELLILAIVVASISRTFIFEEIFREPREWCKHRSETCQDLLRKKFFYLFTCEYCFSHWVTLVIVAFANFRLVFADWRGYIVSFFSLVFVANAYLNLYSRLRVEISKEKALTKTLEENGTASAAGDTLRKGAAERTSV